MARLSEEHYRATASFTSTPRLARTSGRLRDIFKTRRSESSTSPKTLTKVIPPTLETFDVLPGVRDSSQSVTKEDDRVVDEEPESPTDLEGGVSGMALTTIQGYCTVQTTDAGMMTESGTEIEVASKAEVESVSALSVSTPVQYENFAEQDAGSQKKSFASNIFDDQGSLSTGIREYVESKIAEAFHKHSCDCPVRSPLNITAKFELDSGGDMPRSSSFQRVPVGNSILHGRKRIGPFVLDDSSTASRTQIGILGAYLAILLLSAFS